MGRGPGRIRGGEEESGDSLPVVESLQRRGLGLSFVSFETVFWREGIVSVSSIDDNVNRLTGAFGYTVVDF